MKLKLDENLGARGKGILRAEGHDAATVPQERLQAPQTNNSWLMLQERLEA